MKIAIPISRFDRGGGIRVLTILANGLAERGHQVYLVVPRGQHRLFFPISPKVNLTVVGPDAGEIKYVSGFIRQIELIYGLPKVDVAIANGYMTAYSVRLSGLLGKSKHQYYFIQGYEPEAFGVWSEGGKVLKYFKTWLARSSYRLQLKGIANSNWVAEAVFQASGRRPGIVRLGVDTSVFKPLQKDGRAGRRTTVLTIGNSNPVKRFGLFIAAIEQLRQEVDCIGLVAANRQELADEAPYFRYALPQNDSELVGLYQQSDLFISTSASEGFGLPLLEAMACGIPVLTTDSKGMRDFCTDGENCIIAEPTATDLAAAAGRILADGNLRNKLIMNGLATAREWKWENLIAYFDNEFNQLRVGR